ncbi:MAG: D-alanyl-lipoteichoic acid biosynthesis protein DltD [Caldilineaceae bacterium]
MKTPHLYSASVALALAFAAALVFNSYAQWQEDRYIHAIAPLNWFQKTAGGALQRSALRQPDLLPIYGSSELRDGDARPGRALLATYPTGFMIFPIGWLKAGPLSMALTLAASASAGKNRKIVISLAPAFFSIDDSFYEGSYTNLNANELVFSTQLSLALKHRFAERMLQFPQTVAQDFILRFALNQLAHASFFNRCLYAAVFPLGRLQLWIYRLQDHWRVYSLIQAKQLTPTVKRQPAPVDWTKIIAELSVEAERHANSNPFGFENDYWKTHKDEVLHTKNDWPDAKLTQAIQTSREWNDLDLLLSEAKELGVRAIILSVPIKGSYWDYRGNTAAARALYYQKIEAFGARYGMPVFTFADHEADKYFISDTFDHLSRRGWAYYAQTLDAFYHDQLH